MKDVHLKIKLILFAYQSLILVTNIKCCFYLNKLICSYIKYYQF